MQETLECIECKGNVNSKDLKAIESRILVEDKEYICNYFICPICNKINVVTIDNDLTYKVWKELNKNNTKLKTYFENGCKVSQNMRTNNVKLRLKLNLLRQTLYKSLLGQGYQILDKESNIITSGIIKLPNLESEEESK